jgi:hypothetical protein
MEESDFETELRTFRPAPPSKTLAEDVARAMSARVPTAGLVDHPRDGGSFLSVFRPLLWAVGGAAAAAALLVSFRTAVERREASRPVGVVGSALPGGLQPVSTERSLIDAQEEEFVCDDALEEPARRLRFVFLERHTWADQESGAFIEVEVPREDIFLVPVAMQ